MLPRRLFCLALSGLSLLAASCGSGETRVATFPVTGKVLVRGKPAANATVILHPLTPSEAPKPRGTTGADGSFQLTTYDGNDGAPAGEYRVTVQQFLANPAQADQPPKNRLSDKFGVPDSSGLTAKVEAKPTELTPFDVQ